MTSSLMVKKEPNVFKVEERRGLKSEADIRKQLESVERKMEAAKRQMQRLKEEKRDLEKMLELHTHHKGGVLGRLIHNNPRRAFYCKAICQNRGGPSSY